MCLLSPPATFSYFLKNKEAYRLNARRLHSLR